MTAEAPATPPPRRWRDALAVYRDRRMLAILLMGFSSGLPLLLTLGTLSYWLSKVGVSRTTIGLFALVGVPYTFKFAWAPLLDQMRAPLFERRLGRRRGWALLIQILLAGAILAMGFSDPAADPALTAAAALAVAFFSASQDVVVDAYRIEILSDDEQGAGAAATQIGYRGGLIVAGAGAIALADFVPWPAIFAGLALCMGVGMLAVLIADEPVRRAPQAAPADGGAAPAASGAFRFLPAGVRDSFARWIAAPFVEFGRHKGWFAILLFALLYKFGDAIGGTMANPFYNEMGFTGVEIAGITKVIGVAATLAGIAAGGVLVARYGLFRALLVGGVLQAATNLLFAWQATLGRDLGALTVSIATDNFTGGLGSAAFVAYLSSLCAVGFAGTQYALLTSLMAFGRTVLSSGSGWLVDQLGWVAFFVSTTFLAVPGLLLLLWLWRLDRARRPPD